MKIAAFRTGDEFRVGRIEEMRRTVCAFDLSLSEAHEGMLALTVIGALENAFREPVA